MGQMFQGVSLEDELPSAAVQQRCPLPAHACFPTDLDYSSAERKPLKSKGPIPPQIHFYTRPISSAGLVKAVTVWKYSDVEY